MAFSCYTSEIKTKCVVWNTALPHPRDTYESPIFSLGDGFDWYFSVNSGWNDGEMWMINLKTLAGSKQENTIKNYVVIPYAKGKEKYFRLARTIHDTWLKKSYLTHFIYKGVITFLFLVADDDLSMSPNLNETSDSGESVDTLCLKSLSDDILQLLDNKNSVDTTMKCGDKSIPVHRAILAARSEVFSAMFTHDMSEKNSGELNNEDLNPLMLEPFVKYLYSGRVDDMSLETAVELYQAGNKYAIKSLKQLCASYILRNLSEDIVCEMLLLADEASDEEFLDGLASFVVGKEEFMKKDEWRNFALKNSSAAMKVYLKKM